jgi:hypothetical protein
MEASGLQRILNVIPKDTAAGTTEYAIMLLMLAYGVKAKVWLSWFWRILIGPIRSSVNPGDRGKVYDKFLATRKMPRECERGIDGL